MQEHAMYSITVQDEEQEIEEVPDEKIPIDAEANEVITVGNPYLSLHALDSEGERINRAKDVVCVN